MIQVKKAGKSEKYKLGENFTTNPMEGLDNPSLFFDPTTLFKEGIKKEEFIAKYQEMIAISLFGIEKDGTDNSVDLSSLSQDELADIAEAAEKYFNALDKDGNEVLSEEEIGNLAVIDGDSENISDEDIQALTDELFKEATEETDAPEEADSPEETDSAKKTGGSGGGGGGSSVYNKQYEKQDTINKEKTIKELKEERAQKQSELDTARNELKSIYEEGNKNVNEAKKAYDEAVKNDEKISQELKEKQSLYSEQIANKEKEITPLKSELVDVKANIANYNSEIASKNAELSGLNAALSELESATAEDDEAKTRIANKKAEIAKRKETLEKEIKELEEKLQKEQARKEELEEEIPIKEEELSILQSKKEQVDNEILENCSDATKEALTAYKKAQDDAKNAITKAETNIEELQATIDAYDKTINERKAIETKNEYNESKCNYDFELNGKTYKSIVPQDYAEKFLAAEWAKGNYNHDSNCYAMAVKYCEDMMKDLGLKGSWHDLDDDSQAVIEAKSKEMLDKGYPIVLHVSTKAGTRHFETAIGYIENEDGTIEFLCLDNVQGVGISTCGKNGYRHLMSGKESPYKNQHTYGYRMMFYG